MTEKYVVRWTELFREGRAPSPEVFAHAPDATTALLIVDGTVSGEPIVSKGDHAEHLLLGDNRWKRALETAGNAGATGREPLTVTVAINRSPCHFRTAEQNALKRRYREFFEPVLANPGNTEGLTNPKCGCSLKLASAVATFWKQHPTARAKFLLACTGQYWPDERSSIEHLGMTKPSDLAWLLEAGWDVRVLEINGRLTARGQWLVNELEGTAARLTGNRA